MPKKVRIVLVLIIVLVAAGTGGYYLYRQHPADTGDLTLYGNVDIREVQAAFNASGRINDLAVKEGDHVHKGDLLATLDDTLYATALAQAKAAMQAARITYENDGVVYRRLTHLATTDAAAVQDRDNARATWQAAGANYQARQAAVAQARKQLDDARLYAPVDGVIENRILETGDMASPATPVYTLALTNPVWVRAYVPEQELGRVRTGMAAAVSTDSYPNKTYNGWVGYLSPVAEFTPKTVETPELRTALVYELRVYVCNTQGELRLGMPATVKLDTTRTALSSSGQPADCEPGHAPQ